jgi:ketosteroid isomerase-like protein
MLRQRARAAREAEERAVASRRKRSTGVRKRRAQPKRGSAPGVAALALALRELADRRAIEDAVICYGHALDSRDWARLRDCFAEDVRVKYGERDWLVGIEQAASLCAAVLGPLDLSQHRLGTIDVRLDGDRARSTTYLCAEHVRGGQRYTVGGSYVDEWERTPAGWRITQRQLVPTWTDGEPAVLLGGTRD